MQKKNLKKQNKKIAALEEKLEAAEELLEKTQGKFQEVANKLHKSEEKLLLLRQVPQATSIASKIKMMTSRCIFILDFLLIKRLHSFFPIVSNEKSNGSGLTLADDLLVCLINIS